MDVSNVYFLSSQLLSLLQLLHILFMILKMTLISLLTLFQSLSVIASKCFKADQENIGSITHSFQERSEQVPIRQEMFSTSREVIRNPFISEYNSSQHDCNTSQSLKVTKILIKSKVTLFQKAVSLLPFSSSKKMRIQIWKVNNKEIVQLIFLTV